MTLTPRDMTLTLGERSYTGLRVVFSVQLSGSFISTAAMSVYNLGERSRRAASEPDTIVVLESGPRLFEGSVFLAASTLEGPDWVTTIQANSVAGISQRVVRKTWRGGTSYVQVLLDLASEAGLNPGNIATAALNPPRPVRAAYVRPVSFTGSALDALRETAYSGGFDLQVINGNAMLNRSDGSSAMQTVAKILQPIGSVQPQQSGTTLVRVLLDGYLVPRDVVICNGYEYTIESLTHTGDTHGNDWYTDLELTERS